MTHIVDTDPLIQPSARAQWAMAAGYSLILLLPVLLMVGMWLNVPVLAFALVMLVFPLARVVLGGAHPQPAILWSEGVATFLDRLPVAYAGVLLVALLLFGVELVQRPPATALSAVGAGLSLWAALLFGTSVAHDLIHRRQRRDAKVGRFLAAVAGYPLLEFEHLSHHACAGDTGLAEWPRLDESVWRFSWRRVCRIASTVSARTSSIAGHRISSPLVKSAYRATAMTLATWAAFAVAAGPIGFYIYGGAVAGVTLAIQISTYLQHWGLGDDSIPDAGANHFAWEDDCLFQSWMTLNLSFHQSHHRVSREPYYRISVAPDSPRLPAGYVVLMFVCFFPPLWRKAMLPALSHWKSHPRQPISPGRNLTCFALYQATSDRSIDR